MSVLMALVFTVIGFVGTLAIIVVASKLAARWWRAK